MAKTFDFPQDLLLAQEKLRQVKAELSALYATLPWSAEPMPGWTRPKEGRRYFESERPDSPGSTDEEKQQVKQLRARELELAGEIFTHPFWATCDDAVRARSALKRAHEQPPAESAA